LYKWELASDPAFRCAGGKRIPFPVHVCLIVIAAIESDLGEAWRVLLHEPAGMLESKDAGRGLGSDADFAAESLAEMTLAVL
jgi:hypothetical protein